MVSNAATEHCIGEAKARKRASHDPVIIDVDTSLFTQMCRELAQRCDKPPETALREETGKIFTQTIRNTDAADIGKIKRRSEQARFALQPTTLYSPRNPGRRHLKSGRVAYNLAYHYPNALWRAIQQARAKDLEERIAARGLAKRSWFIIAELLGLAVEAPGYVKAAKPRGGREYPQDEKVRVIRESGLMGYEFENSQPTVNAIHGEVALQRAIDGRVQFFLKNVSKDVFDSLAAVAKKYPGMEVT